MADKYKVKADINIQRQVVAEFEDNGILCIDDQAREAIEDETDHELSDFIQFVELETTKIN